MQCKTNYTICDRDLQNLTSDGDAVFVSNRVDKALEEALGGDVELLPLGVDARVLRGRRVIPVHVERRTGEVRVGSAITPRLTEGLCDRDYADFVRANVEYMRSRKVRRKSWPSVVKHHDKQGEPIVEAVDPALLEGELDKIRGEFRLFEQSEYEIFCAPPEAIPMLLHEITRLREVTYRAIGEGTMREVDTDAYDAYYRQLFIWDRETRRIIGAYRLGMGDEIVPRFGLRGFYVDSLFRMGRGMESVMERTIELGRSFVIEEYQRRPVSLMLLWKGILYVLLRHGQYRNLLGPVTISGEFDNRSKMVIVNYLRRHHIDRAIARRIRPLTGLAGVHARIDERLTRRIDNIALIDKLVRDIEHDALSIPILIKKYLQLNSHVIAFNVDHGFCDALDALMLLDLTKVPDATIQMLSKEIADIDVVARFRDCKG